MRSVVDRNVVMRRMTVIWFLFVSQVSLPQNRVGTANALCIS